MAVMHGQARQSTGCWALADMRFVLSLLVLLAAPRQVGDLNFLSGRSFDHDCTCSAACVALSYYLDHSLPRCGVVCVKEVVLHL